MSVTAPAYVTAVPWSAGLQHPIYGDRCTYDLAARWLAPCATIADWGGGTGYFGTCVRPEATYTVVDGTQHAPTHVLADLADYHAPSDGILLRHVLDVTEQWGLVLQNALAACRHRLVVVTFTPAATVTGVVRMKSGWAVRHFCPDDLRRAMGPWLQREARIQTTHPERLYYLERPQ